MAGPTGKITYQPDGRAVVDARGIYYRQLNEQLRQLVKTGAKEIDVINVYGQRYLGTSIPEHVKLRIYGTPGNDMAFAMHGPEIEVFGNAQDGLGNTMDEGEVIVHGSAGDVLAMSMRGGSLWVKGNVGYRCGIHMKEYGDKVPLVVIGGSCQDFFGEYMAGGSVVLLGLGLAAGETHKAAFMGTGMHAGRIFVRGTVDPGQVGKEVGLTEPDAAELEQIRAAVRRYVELFGGDEAEIMATPFVKMYPKSLRPYGRLYAY
jgi:glutamate synthase domain-containing protein 3